MPLLLVDVSLPFLGELAALFTISVLIAYICYRIRLVSIVGFLLAGVVMGPGGLGFAQDLEMINSTAEIGVILLLFTIGIEFSLAKLSRMGKSITVGGSLQITLTLIVVLLVLIPLGVGLSAAIFTGFLVALSSTAIVLTLLSERNETDTPEGRLSFAVLIFQDLAIIVMVLLIPLLGTEATGSTMSILFVLGRALLLIAAVLFLARKLVPWLLERVIATRRQELFLLSVVAVCLGTAFAASLFGISLALGAFLAGLIVSESRHSEHALSEILPLRTIFNAIFFVSIGMLLDVRFFIGHLPLVLAVTGGVLIVKFLTTAGTVLIIGYPVRIAAAVGLTLAQIGEFSFVLERAGLAEGVSPAGMGPAGGQIFIAVTVLLMMLTPLNVGVARAFSERLGRLLQRKPVQERVPDESVGDTKEDHVIVVGLGSAGRRLVSVLNDTGIPYAILELNPTNVSAAERAGLPIIGGDATRSHLLLAAGIHRAKMCVVAINDSGATRQVVQLARYLNPTLQIIVRTRYMKDVELLQKLGADIVVPEELETSVRIFTQVLGAYMVPPEEITRHVDTIRSDDYRILRGSIQEAHLMVLQGLDEEGLHTRAVAVREGAPAQDRSLAELALRREYGLSVLAVRRGDQTKGNPAGEFRLMAGDRLVLVGTAEQFLNAADLFRPAPHV